MRSILFLCALALTAHAASAAGTFNIPIMQQQQQHHVGMQQQQQIGLASASSAPSLSFGFQAPLMGSSVSSSSIGCQQQSPLMSTGSINCGVNERVCNVKNFTTGVITPQCFNEQLHVCLEGGHLCPVTAPEICHHFGFPQCYSKLQYVCLNSNPILCPTHAPKLCGEGCYNEEEYTCESGKATLKAVHEDVNVQAQVHEKMKALQAEHLALSKQLAAKHLELANALALKMSEPSLPLASAITLDKPEFYHRDSSRAGLPIVASGMGASFTEAGQQGTAIEQPVAAQGTAQEQEAAHSLKLTEIPTN